MVKSLFLPLLVLCIFVACTKNKKSEQSSSDSSKLLYNSVNQEMNRLDAFFKNTSHKQIESFGEINLDANATELYRLVYFRSFEQPIVISISKQNKYLLVAQELRKDTTITIKKEITKLEWDSFKSEIDGAYFWDIIPTYVKNPDEIVLDGSSWTLEGQREQSNELRRYHSVTRSSPKKGSFRNACVKLIEYSGLVLSENIY